MEVNNSVVHMTFPFFFFCDFQMLGSIDQIVTPSIYRVPSHTGKKHI